VERDWLSGVLWPESTDGQSRDYLRHTLTELRQALGSESYRLRSPSSHTISLDVTDAQVDVASFDEAIARGDTVSLDTAVSLYRGPLLEGCAEEWLLPEREVREQAYLNALESLAAQAMERGSPTMAADYLRQVVTVDVLREHSQRGLMKALAANGEYASATQVYRNLRQRLYENLQVEPAPETRALFEQISAEPARRAPTPSTIPPLDVLMPTPSGGAEPTE